jgi:transposase InsO family protein
VDARYRCLQRKGGRRYGAACRGSGQRPTPGALEAQIAHFVEHYNYRRYHESLQNLTPADVYLGRGRTILLERERIKRDTIKQRRLQHQSKAA